MPGLGDMQLPCPSKSHANFQNMKDASDMPILTDAKGRPFRKPSPDDFDSPVEFMRAL